MLGTGVAVGRGVDVGVGVGVAVGIGVLVGIGVQVGTGVQVGGGVGVGCCCKATMVAGKSGVAVTTIGVIALLVAGTSGVARTIRMGAGGSAGAAGRHAARAGIIRSDTNRVRATFNGIAPRSPPATAFAARRPPVGLAGVIIAQTGGGFPILAPGGFSRVVIRSGQTFWETAAPPMLQYPLP